MKPILLLIAACAVFACGDAVNELVLVPDAGAQPDAGIEGVPVECVGGETEVLIDNIEPGKTEAEVCWHHASVPPRELCHRYLIQWIRGTNTGWIGCNENTISITVF